MAGFELPFTGWAKDKFNLGGSDEIEDTTDYPYEDPGELLPKPPADPLSDEGMSLGFFRDDALKSRGWTPEAQQWAKTIPINQRDDIIKHGVSGLQWPDTNHVEIAATPEGPPLHGSWSRGNLEHELIHAWEQEQGHPSQQDYEKVRRTTDPWYEINNLLGRNDPVPDHGVHYTHELMDDMIPSQIPDWYRKQYMGWSK